MNDDFDGKLEVTIKSEYGVIKLTTLSGLSCVSDVDPMFYKPCPWKKAFKSLTFRAFEQEVNDAVKTVVYIPDKHYFGRDSILIEVNDQGFTGFGGSLSTQAVIPITVKAINTSPEISYSVDTVTIEEDSSFSLKKFGIDILDHDKKPYDILALKISVLVGKLNGKSDITLKGNIKELNEDLNSLTYESLQNSNIVSHGRDEIFLSIEETSETFFVIVNAVNDPPIIKIAPNAPPLITNEDKQLKIYGIEVFDVDLNEGGAQMLNVTFQVTHGELRIEPRLLKFMKNGTEPISFLNVIGESAALNKAFNGMEYFPPCDFNGNVTLHIFVDDMESGGLLSSSLNLQIHVSSVLDPPFIATPFYEMTIDEDTSVYINGTTFSDIDGEDQNMYIVTLETNFGTISINERFLNNLIFLLGDGKNNTKITFCGSMKNAKAALHLLSYTPSMNFNSNKFVNDIVSIQITRIKNVRDMEGYKTSDDNTSSAKILVIVKPIPDILELFFQPDFYTIVENSILTNVNFHISDPDIGDTELPISHSTPDEVECLITTNVGLIYISLLETISGVVIIIQDEEELERLLSPQKSDKSKQILFRTDIQGVRNVLNSLTYEPLPHWSGNDTITVKMHRTVEYTGKVIDPLDAESVGEVIAQASIKVLPS